MKHIAWYMFLHPDDVQNFFVDQLLPLKTADQVQQNLMKIHKWKNSQTMFSIHTFILISSFRLLSGQSILVQLCKPQTPARHSIYAWTQTFTLVIQTFLWSLKTFLEVQCEIYGKMFELEKLKRRVNIVKRGRLPPWWSAMIWVNYIFLNLCIESASNFFLYTKKKNWFPFNQVIHFDCPANLYLRVFYTCAAVLYSFSF